MLAFALGAVAQWQLVGTTSSRLRVFVDRQSIVMRGALREAIVRIGSPGLIAGRIAIVYELEQFDCQKRQWRLISYRGVDSRYREIVSKPAGPTPPPMLAVQPDSLGETVLDAVCAIKAGQ